ncbi:MAG: hypothetical protein Q9193_005263 [Seirophora villosa]
MSVAFHPIERKLVESQRSSSQKFICPYCPEGFLHEPRLWEHVKNLHAESLNTQEQPDFWDPSDQAGYGKVRSQIREKALEKAYVVPKHFTLSPPKKALLASPITDVHRLRTSRAMKKRPRRSSQLAPSNDDPLGSNTMSALPTRRPDPDIPKNAGDRIEALDRLTIGQPSGHAISPISPLKRRPADGPELLQMDRKSGTPTFTGSNIRHGKSLSIGTFVVTDPDYARDAHAAMAEEPTRNYHGPLKRLYNPDLDNPGTHPYHPVESYVAQTTVKPRWTYGTSPPPAKPGDAIASPFAHVTKKTGRPGSAPTDRPVSWTRTDREYTDPHAHPVEPHWEKTEEAQPQIIRQPETKQISHDQLVVEVKGIYAGLVLVEQKCKEVDEKQSAAALERDPDRKTPLSNEQWQALIALHKTLLHEHHDFFLASQHPSASPTLSKLAGKYSMPARMWRHGIHAFLEVLRHRLPASSDHMLAFIYIAYSMMALLYETVSAFEETWIECLGDLARYRMAIEEHDVQDREIWGGVARFWYSKAADKRPEVGRLYHHLAILARPNSLQQLSLYAMSLACVVPFISARSSIMTLFQPMIQGKASSQLVASQHRLRAFEVAFIRIHANLFVHEQPTNEVLELFENIQSGLLDDYIGRVTTRFREQGVSIAFANIAALFGYGGLGADQTSKSIFRFCFLEVWVHELKSREIEKGKLERALDLDEDKHKSLIDSLNQQTAKPPSEEEIASSMELVRFASKINFTVLTIVLQRPGDKNVFPLVHVMFCFVWSLARVEKVLKYVEQDIPWGHICSFLNALAKPDAMTPKIWAKTLPMPDGGVTQPLPEDFAMRGQLCSLWYYPDKWFEKVHIDIEERSLEMPSMAASRIERILWLGMGIASLNRWISYNETAMKFSLNS